MRKRPIVLLLTILLCAFSAQLVAEPYNTVIDTKTCDLSAIFNTKSVNHRLIYISKQAKRWRGKHQVWPNVSMRRGDHIASNP